MRLRALLGLLIPLAFAALFIRLGVWQLERHLLRSAFNGAFASRLVADPIPFDSLGDPFSAEWRRVSLAGRFRYDLEQVQAGRTNAGSPGVHLLTPLERPGNDTLVIVTRGWVYSPNAGNVDLARWREGDSVSLTGYVLTLPDDSANVPPADRPLRTLDRQPLRARVGAPISEFQVVMTSDSTARIDSVPRRLALPVMDGGPHFSYMIQWFAFALVAIVGGIALFVRGRQSAG